MDTTFISNLILATVRMAVPLIFITTAELYSERAGMVNIGLEGLAAIGSLVGFVMCYATGSAWLGILGGALAGILVNMIYAFATVTLCANQTVYGMAINIFAPALASFINRIYFGAGGQLNHTSVKVSVGDTFAETPMTNDSYTTTDLGRTIEKADYKVGNDGGVTGFIVANADKNIQLTFIGDKTYRTAIQKNDRKAIVELTELARILSGMEEIRKQQKEANLKIQFVTRKIEEGKAAEVQE